MNMKIAEIETDWEERLSANSCPYLDENGRVDVEIETEYNQLCIDIPRADLARFAAQIAKAMPDEFQAALDALNEEC